MLSLPCCSLLVSSTLIIVGHYELSSSSSEGESSEKEEETAKKQRVGGVSLLSHNLDLHCFKDLPHGVLSMVWIEEGTSMLASLASGEVAKLTVREGEEGGWGVEVVQSVLIDAGAIATDCTLMGSGEAAVALTNGSIAILNLEGKGEVDCWEGCHNFRGVPSEVWVSGRCPLV